jgi:hypothetical protein
MKKYQTHIIWAFVVVVALVGGFIWGKSSVAATSRTGFAGAGGTFSSSTRSRFGGGAAAGGGLTTGQITAMDSQSITLQLANGNSEVIFYSTSTTITKPTNVPASDLATGSNVMVVGTANSDGSVTAQSIQVRAAGGPLSSSTTQ